MKKFYNEKLIPLFANIKEDAIGIHTGQSSFFMTLSVFPFLLLLLNILSLLPKGKAILISILNSVSGNTINDFITDVINDLSNNSTGLTISISAIIVLWSASKGVHSLMLGLGRINNLHKNRSYVTGRLISMIYTIAFIAVIVVTMGLLVFGNRIVKYAVSLLPKLKGASYLSMIFRYFIMFVFFLVFFMLCYRLSNKAYTTFKKVFWGSLFAAVGWIVFSLGFNIYIDHFFASSYMYGSLASFIVLMLWTYFCIYIFFLGHEINKTLHPEIVAPDDDKLNQKIELINKFKQKKNAAK